MNLYIDTTEYGKVVFILKQAGKKDITGFFNVKPHESGNILGDLDKFLKKAKVLSPKLEISELIVFKGKGSFTGLRIAAAIAEALSLAWGKMTKIITKKGIL
jgi:tRNA A37 threonylcarbamoyladenosine modification protein TsaB